MTTSNTIPASDIASVTPNVLAAGGSGLVLNGLVLTENTRVPIGSVMSFASASDVATFFGTSTTQQTDADIYFAGFDNSNIKPGAMLYAQYPGVAVAAYLRGGNVSGLSLAQLQALNGTVIVTVDGSGQTGTANLASATSFSSAATLLTTALNTATVATGTIDPNVVTARIDPTAGTGSISGTTMTLSAVTRAGFAAGQSITGIAVEAGTTIVAQLTGTAGSTGTYQVSIAQTVPGGTAITANSGTMVVSAVTTGALFVGQVISGTGVTSGTTVTAFLASATGGTGTYAVSVSQTVTAGTTITGTGGYLNISAVSSGTFGVGDIITGTGITAGNHITAFKSGTGTTGTYFVSVGDSVGSETISVAGAGITVTYDSVSGAFIITSGTTGGSSSMTFATGTISTNLKLTSATGATLSQGAAAASPNAFMSALVLLTQNWAAFTTDFDPDASGNSNKEAFADWNNSQGNRYVYVPWDTDITPTTTLPATNSLGYYLQQNNDSGTAPIWAPDEKKSMFILGAIASIDFNQTNGRITFAFKAQSGLTADVTSQTAAHNLAGNPQTSGFGNGYNYYGAYATANDAFTFFQRGTVSGDFEWLDSYVNQIWLNNALQLDLVELLAATRSIPYNTAGYSLIEAALGDTIAQAVDFGAINTGVTLSSSQKAAVNAAAGLNIAPTLESRGWYLQVKPANATTRAGRTSPECTFWYTDGGSVQAINLTSVEVQ